MDLSKLVSEMRGIGGGICTSINEFKDAQFGLPLKHYCLQYLFGSTGLRYGSFNMLAGKPKSCKSPFAFFLGHLCCEHNGLSLLYELEGKASSSLMYSMFADHPEWMADDGPFQIISGLTLDKASAHLTKGILKYLKKAGKYDVPCLIDWDSISGAGMSDVVDKISSEGFAAKGYYDKSHIMKHLSENWTALLENLPIVFVGVLQEKKKAAEGFSLKGPESSYGGGDSQLFKASNLISFNCSNLTGGYAGKMVRIKTVLNGFADAREINVRFTWDQFGSLETESQGHKWRFAEATAKVLAEPKIVGDLRDIIDVKIADNGAIVTCKQFGLDKVPAEEFEKALFAEENSKTLNELYHYQKIDKVRGPDEYAEHVKKLKGQAADSKAAEKEAKKAEREAKAAEAEAEEKAKQQKREAKAKQAAAKLEGK